MGTETPQKIKSIFGIFMICLYVGVGVLLVLNFFKWEDSWAWARWSLAVLFIAYGLWRGYRQFKDLD